MRLKPADCKNLQPVTKEPQNIRNYALDKPFKEVMRDVLKVKPPEKQKKKVSYKRTLTVAVAVSP